MIQVRRGMLTFLTLVIELLKIIGKLQPIRNVLLILRWKWMWVKMPPILFWLKPLTAERNLCFSHYWIISKHQILDERNDLTPVFSLYSQDFRVQQTEAWCLMPPDYTHTDSGVRALISVLKPEQHNLQLWHSYHSTCEENNEKNIFSGKLIFKTIYAEQIPHFSLLGWRLNSQHIESSSVYYTMRFRGPPAGLHLLLLLILLQNIQH